MLVSVTKERLSGCVYRVQLLPLFCIHFSMLRESSGKPIIPNEWQVSEQTWVKNCGVRPSLTQAASPLETWWLLYVTEFKRAFPM